MTKMCALSIWLLIFLFPVSRHPRRSLILFPHKSDSISASRMTEVFSHLVALLIHTPTASQPFLQSEEIGKESESFVVIPRSWKTGSEPIGLPTSGRIYPSSPILFNWGKCLILQPSKYASN